ncbi:hypothetical protein Hte_011804 [Hypoxylon texense]
MASHYIANIILENEKNIRDGKDNGNPGNQHSTEVNYSMGMSEDMTIFIDESNPGTPVMPTLESSEETSQKIRFNDPYSLMFGLADGVAALGYFPVCEHAALYVKNNRKGFDFSKFNDSVVTLEDVLWCFESGFVDRDRLMLVLEQEPVFAFLQVLSTIHTLCRKPTAGGSAISYAIVDSEFNPPIFSKKLEAHNWSEEEEE